MLIIICGDIGSGKTLSAVKEIVDSPNYAFTNFKLKHLRQYYHRLKLSDIETMTPKTFDHYGNPKTYHHSINWEYWNNVRKNYPSFSIYIDEVHNIINSRTSLSKRNVVLSRWVSQIRKVCSDSETNHLYLITQNIRTIDINFRELAHIYQNCRKVVHNGKVIVFKNWYQGYDNFLSGNLATRTYFVGNPYFKFYDTAELIDFEETGYI